jgi:hypothetical protein
MRILKIESWEVLAIGLSNINGVEIEVSSMVQELGLGNRIGQASQYIQGRCIISAGECWYNCRTSVIVVKFASTDDYNLVVIDIVAVGCLAVFNVEGSLYLREVYYQTCAWHAFVDKLEFVQAFPCWIIK